MNSFESIMETIKNNQFLLTGLGLSGAGILTFWFKDIPNRIYNILKREFTTQLTITNQHKAYYNFLIWIERNYPNKNFRRLKVSNGKWGDDNAITSIGYGIHCILYKGHFLILDLIKESANQTNSDKESIMILKIGRSRKLFDELIREITTIEQGADKIEIFKMDNYWTFTRRQKKRNLDSVYIENDKKKFLIETLDKFISNEDWYIKNGIPYQLGILLYGSPGTGKTSLIRAISSYLNYPIYYISPDDLDKMENAMSSLPDNCLVVIEDIDSNRSTHSRKKDDNTLPVDNIMELISVNLSEVLNSIDGLFSAHGRILIATTNHIEKLDEALIRPGRIDIKLEIGFVNNEILRSFLKSFFPNDGIDSNQLNNIKIKPRISVATLQNLILLGKDWRDIIDYIKE